MTIDDAKTVLAKMRQRVITDDFDSTVRKDNEDEAIDTILELCENMERYFTTWASAQKLNFCCTCGNRSDYQERGTMCPIEEHYRLPEDGYCHLWKPFNKSK